MNEKLFLHSIPLCIESRSRGIIGCVCTEKKGGGNDILVHIFYKRFMCIIIPQWSQGGIDLETIFRFFLVIMFENAMNRYIGYLSHKGH